MSVTSPPDLPATEAGHGRTPDPRGVRVSLVPAAAAAGLAPLIIEPPQVPVAPPGQVAGTGLSGGAAPARSPGWPDAGPPGHVLANGVLVEAGLLSLDAEHAILVQGGLAGTRDRVLLLPLESAPSAGHGVGRGVARREVVVEGWRIEVDVEPAARAALRDRARRAQEGVGHGGPTEVRAIIPGVVVSVSVVPGDAVTAGQQLLVVEAMKMQNELRAPRDGTIERVAVGAGRTIEVGDLLLVIS